MERLTEKVFGFVQLKACGNDFCKETCAEHDEEKSCKNCHIQKAFEKLGEYEDLDERGLLLRLPCKVGDIIYRVNTGAKEPVIKMRVLQVIYKQLHKDRIIIRIDAINDNDMGETRYLLEDFGRTVFLTQAEAEQKLKEMNTNNGITE